MVSILDKNVQCASNHEGTIRKMQNSLCPMRYLVEVFKNHCHGRRECILGVKRLRRQQPKIIYSSWLDPGLGENSFKNIFRIIGEIWIWNGYQMKEGVTVHFFLRYDDSGVEVGWENVLIVSSCFLKVIWADLSWGLQLTFKQFTKS